MTKLLIIISSVLLFVSCSSPSKTTVNTPDVTTNTNFPAWFGPYRFSTDNAHFNANATAISAEKDQALIRAEKEARANLESYIAKEIENIRQEIEADGSRIVTNPSFILKLRNAHYKVEKEAIVIQSEVRQIEGAYRGFVSVRITKQKVGALLKQGLSSDSNYAKEFLNSVQLTALLGS